jgi:lipopolysaccharide transport system permease protein
MSQTIELSMNTAPADEVLERTETPVTVIVPQRRWLIVDLQDLWAYRELLAFLCWRDIKVRYKQTVLGGAWAILQPLMTMIVFTLFFARLANVPSGGVPYPLFAFAGPSLGRSSPTRSEPPARASSEASG